MTDFRHLLQNLSTAGVEFILVGGVAATVHGSSRLTRDLDVVYSRTPENLDRIVSALAPLSPYLRDVPPGLPFRWDSDTLSRGLNFTLTTDAGAIDLFGEIVGGGTYESLRTAARPIEVYGVSALCIDLPSLIQAKRAAGRPRDLEAIAELERLLDEQDSR